ncbi:Dabb family protein [Streptomyces tendae]
MIIHVSSMRLKPHVSEAAINQVFQALQAIPRDVPGVLEVRCGRNVSRHAGDHSHVVFVRAEDDEALEAYRAHPDHRAMRDSVDVEPRHDKDLPVIGADLVY